MGAQKHGALGGQAPLEELDDEARQTHHRGSSAAATIATDPRKRRRASGGGGPQVVTLTTEQLQQIIAGVRSSLSDTSKVTGGFSEEEKPSTWNVGSALVLDDKAKALLGVEEFNGSGRHAGLLLRMRERLAPRRE